MFRKLAALILPAFLGICCTPVHANVLEGFGSDAHDYLGVGFKAGPIPATVVQLPEAPAAFSRHTALLADGELFSWGGNSTNQIGDGRKGAFAPFPALIARGIAQPGDNCALTTLGVVLGWGGNAYGQAGQGVPGGGTEAGGARTSVPTPAPVKGLPAGPVKSLLCESAAHYVLYANGNLYGWGNNSQSELGGAKAIEVLHPKLVASGVVEAAAGGAEKYEDVLAMRHADGSIWMLGSNDRGQAGTGKLGRPITAPTRVKLPGPAVAVDASRSNVIVLLADGTVETWGLRDGTAAGVPCAATTCAPTPHPVPAAKGATSIAAGVGVGYAVTGGQLVAWGNNDSGQQDLLPQSETVSPPTVRIASGVVRVVAQENGALIETTGFWVPPVIKAVQEGKAARVTWTGGTGNFTVGLAECTGGVKERETKSKTVARTTAHTILVPVPHTGEWEISSGSRDFARKTVRVTVTGATIRGAR